MTAFIYQTMRVELKAAIKRHAHLLEGTILDAGAGSADRYSTYFKAKKYVRMNQVAGAGTDVVGDVGSISVADNSFDGIVCTQVLGDVYELKKALSEFHRVLKNGGKVLLTESFIDPLHDEPNDYWRFTHHALKRLFEEAGFRVMVLERIGGYHSMLAQLKTRYAIEKHGLYAAWYGRLANVWLKVRGKVAFIRDRHDRSDANKRFAQGWLVVAEKR